MRADKDRLIQVVINLLSNAVKFSDPERGRIWCARACLTRQPETPGLVFSLPAVKRMRQRNGIRSHDARDGKFVSAARRGGTIGVFARIVGACGPAVVSRTNCVLGAMDYDFFRRCADSSIRRACGFGALAIFTFMVGLSGDPDLAIRAGAVLVTIAAVILYWRGRKAPMRNFRQTEVWLMIRNTPGAPPKERLQRMIGPALAESYFWHADIAARLALVMWGVSVLIWAM